MLRFVTLKRLFEACKHARLHLLKTNYITFLRLATLVGSINGRFRYKLDQNNIFHHGTRITLLFRQPPMQAQFMVQMAVFPFQ